jgi:hypothetical protein
MSVLTESLDRILNWLQQHKPEYASGFLPGLSLEKIEEKVKVLPFRLPSEVYELYQWRNRTKSDESIFVYHYFCDLDTAVELATIEDGLNGSLHRLMRVKYGEPTYVFPIFEFENEYFAVYESTEQIKNFPVFHIYHDYRLAFSNLTSMMLTIAECYETKVYWVSPQGHIEWDCKKYGAIRRKYNPETVNAIYKREIE